MAIQACTICESKFYVKPSHLKLGWGKYCSKTCQYSGQRTGKEFSCFVCKKNIYRMLKDIKNSKSGKYFCSKSCQTTWRNSFFSGDKHKNWNGGTASYKGILTKSGAVQICAKCQNEDKRILAVHHKDKNRKNNAVSNLIWLCHNCHYLIHHHKDESTGFMVPVA